MGERGQIPAGITSAFIHVIRLLQLCKKLHVPPPDIPGVPCKTRDRRGFTSTEHLYFCLDTELIRFTTQMPFECHKYHISAISRRGGIPQHVVRAEHCTDSPQRHRFLRYKS